MNIGILADFGTLEACRQSTALKSGVTTSGGRLTNNAVAKAHDLPFEPLWN